MIFEYTPSDFVLHILLQQEIQDQNNLVYCNHPLFKQSFPPSKCHWDAQPHSPRTHSPTRSTQSQASSTTIYLLPFCSQKYSPLFFSVPSYRTNSIHFLDMFPQGAGDVCVILKLSKLFLFLVFFSQFLHTQFARMVAHCSYCGVSAALRVFFSRVLDSGIF